MRMMRYHLSASAIKAFQQQAAISPGGPGVSATTAVRDSATVMAAVVQAAVIGLGRAPTASDAAVVLLACDRHMGRKPAAARGSSDDRRALAAYTVEAERLVRRLQRADDRGTASGSSGARAAPITTLQAALSM